MMVPDDQRLSRAMRTRESKSRTNPTRLVGWVSASEVSSAIETYTKSIAQAKNMRLDYKVGSWCLDQNRNQIKGCRCVFDLRNKTRDTVQMRGLGYATMCSEIACWFCAAKLTESLLVNGDITQSDFERAFHRSTTLKHHPQGSPTKMVDVTVLPEVKAKSDGVDEYYLQENNNQSVACFCINSLLGLWKVLVQMKQDDMEKWKAFNFQSILYQGGRNRIDSCTQIKRQRLFYARLVDILAAKPEQMSLRLKHAAICYQKMGKLEESEDAVRAWKNKMSSNWKHWKLGSIHVLVANSQFNYSEGTKSMVANLGIKIGRITDKTLATLRQILNGLWPVDKKAHRRPPYWNKVSQDKALWYTTFPHAINITSGLDLLFSNAGGGYRATGLLADMLLSKRKDIEEADSDIKTEILQLLNRGKGIGDQTKKVAFQPSFLVSAVHKPQHAHFDYKGRDLKNKKYWIGFLPITDYGQFLQVWDYKPDTCVKQKGEILFIPRGHLVIVKGNTLHGGGFRAETTSGNALAHARLHFYIYQDVESCQVDVHGNEYYEEGIKRGASMSLSDLYINSDLLGGVAEGGDWCDSMNWNFFQGECPIDKDTGVELKVKVPRPTCGKRNREAKELDD